MTADQIFVAERLKARLLTAAFQRGAEVKRGHSKPLTEKELKACKISLRAIMRGHFRLAEKILLTCHDIWRAVFN